MWVKMSQSHINECDNDLSTFINILCLLKWAMRINPSYTGLSHEQCRSGQLKWLTWSQSLTSCFPALTWQSSGSSNECKDPVNRTGLVAVSPSPSAHHSLHIHRIISLGSMMCLKKDAWWFHLYYFGKDRRYLH